MAHYLSKSFISDTTRCIFRFFNRHLLLSCDDWATLIDRPENKRLTSAAIFVGCAVLISNWHVDNSQSISTKFDIIVTFVTILALLLFQLLDSKSSWYFIPSLVIFHNIVFFISNINVAYFYPDRMDAAVPLNSLIFFSLNSAMFKNALASFLNLFVFLGCCIMYGILFMASQDQTGPTFSVDAFFLMTVIGAVCAVTHISQKIQVASYGLLEDARRQVSEMTINARLAEENLRIREEMVRMNRVSVVEALTSSIAHEVNQPIGSAYTFARAAKRWLAPPSPDLDEARKAINDAVDQISRIGSIIRSIRKMTARQSSEIIRLDLHSILRSLINMVAKDLDQKNITLDFRWHNDLGLIFVSAPSGKIEQVVLNLVNNAADAICERNIAGRILLSVRVPQSGWVDVLVSDNGTGIPPEHLASVTDSFFSTKKGGTGLGLSICLEIAESLGGSLSVESEFGIGTHATLRLPLERQIERRDQGTLT